MDTTPEARENEPTGGGKTPRFGSGDSADDPSPSSAVTSLLAGLRPDTDLPGLVERVHRDNLSRVVVLATSVAAWESRDATGWAQVSEWLAALGVTVVRIGIRPTTPAEGAERDP